MCAVWTRRSGIQLAYPFEIKRLQKYPSPWLVQPKLNGERCRAIIKNGEVTLLSSEENVITTIPHINSTLASLQLPTSLELDGELYVHGLSKQKIGSYLRRKNPAPDHQIIEYHVFDVVAMFLLQIERLGFLYQDIAPILRQISCVRVVDTHKILAYPDLEDLLTYYISKKYEGIIVRNPNGLYERKRTTNMLKWKPRHRDSYRIVGTIEEVDKWNCPKNTLGAIICEKDGERFNVSAGGFTHDKKKELWDARDAIEGLWLLVKYPELTDRGVPNHAVALEITNEEVGDED